MKVKKEHGQIIASTTTLLRFVLKTVLLSVTATWALKNSSAYIWHQIKNYLTILTSNFNACRASCRLLPKGEMLQNFITEKNYLYNRPTEYPKSFFNKVHNEILDMP